MKTNSILIKEGKAFAVCEEIPKEPFKCPKGFPKCDSLYCQCAVDEEDYKSALQRVKDNAVEFEDQSEARHYICYHLNNFSNDALKEGLYPISVEVEIIEACAYDCCPYNAGCQFCREPKKIARIVEEPEEKHPTACNKCFDWKECVEFGCQKPDTKKDSEVEDQESQSELFRQVVELFNHQHKLFGRPDYQLLKERFSITRIKQ